MGCLHRIEPLGELVCTLNRELWQDGGRVRRDAKIVNFGYCN